ncbi:MAG TPA: ROK family protein [Chitinophagaceae bacterium]|nr:ROK family protein [Chitinophagaceae bacterium]
MNIKGRVIGIDLGGTQVRAGKIRDGSLEATHALKVRSQGTVEEVMEDLYSVTDALIDPTVAAIGIGVPSVVDLDSGVVYEVQNIPSWKEVPLRQWMEARYKIPVQVNNDANCFALGELYFGKGMGKQNLIGLTVGTGLGAGIIIGGKLYAGANCGAGEFGMVAYLDKHFEFYCCGQFFTNVYGIDGNEVYQMALAGDARAREMYHEMGTHLGNAIKMILYTYDADLIILGGSVREAYPFFREGLWDQVRTLAYTRTAQKLVIEISTLEHSGLLGAAALCYDADITHK